MTTSPDPEHLPLTGERTVPGLVRENYWFRRHEVVYDWIIETLDLTGADLIEAGCGEGYGAELLRRAGAAVVALDYDASSVAHVRSKYPRVRAVSANLDSFPLDDNSCDIVVSLQVLEHLWNVPRFLAEVRRTLRPGGTAVISTPNRLTFSPGLGRGDKPTNPFHVEEFDAEQLADLFRREGFSGIELHGVRQGARLDQMARASGDIVARQIAAITAEDDWPPQLMSDVASVTTADFEIVPAAASDGPADDGPPDPPALPADSSGLLADSLDLIVVAHP